MDSGDAPELDAREGALPNLVVVGAMKCGTSSLHYYLDLHPEIAMSSPKEFDFFVTERVIPSSEVIELDDLEPEIAGLERLTGWDLAKWRI